MATPLSADRLVAALRAEGVTVVEHPGWRTHNRNRAGAWGPVNGVMIHHTVSSGTASSVALCYNGYSGLPGPLCHGVIAKDGTIHLVGNGRANHAGGGDPNVLAAVRDERYTTSPPTPRQHQGSSGAVDGNAHFYGFECVNLGNGSDPWPAAQLEAIERASAAICRAHGWGAKSVIGHLEWSDWKSDPRGFTMPTMRDRVANRLGAAPDKPTPPIEEDDMPTPAEYAKAVWDHGISNRFRPGAGGQPGVIPARYFMEWNDAHFDELMAAVRQAPAPALAPEQLAALATAVASDPALAEQIAKAVATQVADVIAERMAQ